MTDSNASDKELDSRRPLKELDSSDVDLDMSPLAIQKRLETVGQLARLANYLAQGKIIGQAELRQSHGSGD